MYPPEAAAVTVHVYRVPPVGVATGDVPFADVGMTLPAVPAEPDPMGVPDEQLARAKATTVDTKIHRTEARRLGGFDIVG